FVINQADAFGGGSKLIGLRLRKQCGLQSKPLFSTQPWVGENAGGVEHPSEVTVAEWWYRICLHGRAGVLAGRAYVNDLFHHNRLSSEAKQARTGGAPRILRSQA